MIHWQAEFKPNAGNHYGVSASAKLPNVPRYVLVQLQEDGQQVRIPLTALEARHMANMMLSIAADIDGTPAW